MGASVWYVKSFPALHQAGTAATREERDAEEVKWKLVRPCEFYQSGSLHVEEHGSSFVCIVYVCRVECD